MGITERRQAERELIRKKIFDATSELIIEIGYEKASIRKIAERIEYSPAVIYNYFKDKNEIMEAIVVENYQRVCEHLLTLRLEELPPTEAIEKGLKHFIYAMIENPEHYKATILNGIGRKTHTGNKPEESDASKLLIGIVARGIEEGVFVRQEPGELAFFLITACFGVVNELVYLTQTDKHKIEEVIEGYVDFLKRGIRV